MKLPKYELNKTGKGYRRNWGCVYIDHKGNSEAHQDIAKFIRLMFIEYAECNARSFELAGDFIMGWGELQNQGLIYHSLYEAARRKYRIISEFPFTQNEYRAMEEGDEGKQQHTNRIDYHIHDIKSGRVLLVEYKHSCITTDPKNHDKFPQEFNTDKFTDSLEKFKEPIDEKYINEYLKCVWSSNKRNTFQIVLWMVPVICVRQGDRKEEEFTWIDEKCFKNKLHELRRKFNPNLSGYWWLPRIRQ